ncbi:hypothetical protein OIU34_20105 [Pararhizobium sp. BT-229]|uniref:hypothetical protein n=1 Tax=Pararhizobium sp. BT-229 TaxID=2986923 RepID=UPI0021F7290D|nr:hypothetical protein [Pararhizobium sp. BT-229]MCV9964191.1 hypothetical protein [Pararhizobium sp. BT-229]
MGSDVTIGIRTAEGEALAALSYSHVYGRILIEADFVTPKEEEFRKLVEEYRDDKSYGPRPLAPFGSGITFADFKTRTIFDAQSIAYFPAFTMDTIIRALFEAPSRFDVYVPHFASAMEFLPRPPGDFRIREIVEREFERASDQAGLWKSVGVETVPGTLSNWNDGKAEVVATATVPRGDFAALMLDLPGWTVRHCNPRDKGKVRGFYEDFSASITLGPEDIAAWEEFISEL